MRIKDYLVWILFIGYVFFCHKCVTIELTTYTHPIIVLLLKLIYVPFALIVALAVLLIVGIKLLIGV